MSAPRDTDSMWIILRMAGPRTLAVAASLKQAGFEVWTPARTLRRPAPGQRRRLVLGLRRRMIEVEVPMLPGFAFARARHLQDIASLALDPASRHPIFSVFQVVDRAPLISDSGLAGLRDAEAREAAAAEAMRDAETREEAQRLRAEQMRTERARRKALRRQRKDFHVGECVAVLDMPALAGLVGEIVETAGTSATIDFGGTLTMKVEAWRVIPSALLGGEASSGIAA